MPFMNTGKWKRKGTVLTN